MKLIKPSFKIIEQPSGMNGIYKMIELAGRTAYKSEHLITENSAKEFTDRMIKLNHGAPLEHGTVYLKLVGDEKMSEKYQKNPYSRVVFEYPKDDLPNIYCIPTHYITTNYRVLIEHNWIEDLKYLCEPTEYHEKRVCVRFILSRSIAQEYTRHRIFSFLMESQRYCNYSKNKFNNEITYICPCWLDYNKVQKLTEITNKDNKEVYKMVHDESLSMEERGLYSFIYDMSNHEHGYLFQISAGWKPQEAREVLPNAAKTELVMTGFVSDWKHFFKLRCSDSAHPQARELAEPLKEEFIKRGYLNNF